MTYELTAREKARLEAVTSTLIERAAAEGLSVSAEQLAHLTCVRMAVLTDLGLSDNAMSEVRKLVPDQVRAREVERQLNDAESDLHKKELARMNIYQRAALGHDLEAARKATEAARPPVQMSAEEEATKLLALRQISHPAQRLAIAREWGLA